MLVTGASGGIGRAVSQAFGGDGMVCGGPHILTMSRQQN